MSDPKKHHFVPKWHLEKFVDEDGFLHIYDKANNAFRRQKPRKVMVVSHYYRQTWTPEGVDQNILEKSLGAKLEPEANAAFNRLLIQAPDINDTETAAMLAYLELQRIRVPRQAKHAKQLLRKKILKDSSPEVMESILSGQVNININDSFRFGYMRLGAGQIDKYFSRMEWEVIEAEESSSFVITDSPVTYHNVDFLPPDEAGIALVGTKVFFPLNKLKLLILRHPEYSIESKISASDKIPEPKLKDGRIKVVFGRVWTEEQVNRVNWLMMQLSDRYIAGCNREILESMVNFDNI